MNYNLTIINLLIETMNLKYLNQYNSYDISNNYSITAFVSDFKDFINLSYRVIEKSICRLNLDIYLNDENIILYINGERTRSFIFERENLRLFEQNKDIMELVLVTNGYKSIFDKDILYTSEEKFYNTLIDYKHHLIKGIQNEL